MPADTNDFHEVRGRAAAELKLLDEKVISAEQLQGELNKLVEQYREIVRKTKQLPD